MFWSLTDGRMKIIFKLIGPAFVAIALTLVSWQIVTLVTMTVAVAGYDWDSEPNFWRIVRVIDNPTGGGGAVLVTNPLSHIAAISPAR
jgi:hypothetical protein